MKFRELLDQIKFFQNSQIDFDERPHEIIEILKSLLRLGGRCFINVSITDPKKMMQLHRAAVDADQPAAEKGEAKLKQPDFVLQTSTDEQRKLAFDLFTIMKLFHSKKSRLGRVYEQDSNVLMFLAGFEKFNYITKQLVYPDCPAVLSLVLNHDSNFGLFSQCVKKGNFELGFYYLKTFLKDRPHSLYEKRIDEVDLLGMLPEKKDVLLELMKTELIYDYLMILAEYKDHV